MTIPRSVYIGCDPEFVIEYENGNLETRFIADGWENAFGRENGGVFELRPHHSAEVLTVISNIRGILRKGIKRYPFLKRGKFISAPVYEHFALGGHIHISVDADERLVQRGGWGWEDEDDLTPIGRRVVRNLNKFIGRGVTPLLGIDDLLAIRRSYGYGIAGDVRTEWGNRIEYRTPPSWLYSPMITLLYLGTAQLATYLTLAAPRMVVSSTRGRKLLLELFDNVKEYPIVADAMIPYWLNAVETVSPITDSHSSNFLERWGL